MVRLLPAQAVKIKRVGVDVNGQKALCTCDRWLAYKNRRQTAKGLCLLCVVWIRCVRLMLL